MALNFRPTRTRQDHNTEHTNERLSYMIYGTFKPNSFKVFTKFKNTILSQLGLRETVWCKKQVSKRTIFGTQVYTK